MQLRTVADARTHVYAWAALTEPSFTGKAAEDKSIRRRDRIHVIIRVGRFGHPADEAMYVRTLAKVFAGEPKPDRVRKLPGG